MPYAHLFAVSLAVFAFAAEAQGAPRVIKAEGGVEYAVPENGRLSFERFEEPFGSVAFAGRLTISGTYYYGRMAGFPGDGGIGLYFMPDAKDAAGLPYWRDDGRVKEIKFENPSAFIKAVIPPRLARAVERGRRDAVRGRVTLNIDGFEATVVCGGAIYLTRFQSVARRPVLFANKGAHPRTTC